MIREQPKVLPTLEDFGIDPGRPDWCPRCRTSGLELFDSKPDKKSAATVSRWHCKNCGWTDSLSRHAGHALIATAGEIAPAILRWHQTGPPQGESLGFGPMTDELYKVRRGEWTVVTGHPGHGKSQWMDAVLVNLADKSNWKFAVFSPENVPYEQHIRGLMQKFAGKRFYARPGDGPNDAMTREEVLLARKWLDQHFFFVDGDEITFEGLLAQFWKIVKEHDIQGVIIDPWNELESEVPHGVFKGDYIGQCLKRFRSFCKAAHVHGWIVAHPSKAASQTKRSHDEEGKLPLVRLQDISDTAHFVNKCFVGVSVWRDPGDDDRRHETKLFVLKHRTEGVGRPGNVTLTWNEMSTAYHGPDLSLQNGRFPMDRLKAQLDKGLYKDWVQAARREEADWWLQERPLPWKRIRAVGDQKERFEVEDGTAKAVVWSEIKRRNAQEDGPAIRVWNAQVFRDGEAFFETEDTGTMLKAFEWAERQLIQLPSNVAIEHASAPAADERPPLSEEEFTDHEDRQ